jgi:cation diffusion facilitator CzcD-associated flavoprotein CzcO
VDGLEEYIKKYPGRVVHSKYYRSPTVYAGQKVLTIGNSASGFDISNELTETAHFPVYSSRRHKSPFEGDTPPPGVEWKPIITKYHGDGTIEFEDGTTLGADDVDKVIYATGYRPSFPFWNERANGRPIYDYEADKLVNTYWHTFFHDLPTLAAVGIEKALTFRSFEYQAVAVARLLSGRNAVALPPPREQRAWEEERAEWARATGNRFHDVEGKRGRLLGEDSLEWLGYLYRLAGLGTLTGDGRVPPVLSEELLHAVRTIHKYPRHGGDTADAKEWVVVDRL